MVWLMMMLAKQRIGPAHVVGTAAAASWSNS